MPRHRAPTHRTRSLTTLALTGAALGGSVLVPLTAAAAPAHAQSRHSVGTDYGTDDDNDSDYGSDSDTDSDSDENSDSDYADSDDADNSDGSGRSFRDEGSRSTAHAAKRDSRARRPHDRPLTSGERQYRNGCRRGYIVQDCQDYDVAHLLRRGINPFR